MNKKIIGILICTLLIAMITPVLGDTDTIDVTLNPQATASISVNQSAWGPDAGLGDTESTAGDWARLTNDGLVQVDVTIKANDTDSWSLDTSTGHDQFALSWIQTAVELFDDDFESGTGQWTMGNWAESTWKSHSATHSIIADQTDGRVISDSIDTSTYTSFDISFWYYDDSWGGSDNIYFELWNGTAYNTIQNLNGQGTSGQWNEYSTTITDSQYMISDLKVVFNCQMTFGPNALIDDVLIDTSPEDSITTTPASFIDDLSPIGSNTFDFGLKIEMPTSSSTSQSQQTEITFEATAET